MWLNYYMPKKSTHYSHPKPDKSKLAILVLLIVFSILMLGSLTRFTQNLFKPILLGANKVVRWDGNSQLNLVLKTNNISLLSFDPNASTLKIVTIPDEFYVEVPGHGSWQIRSVYDLGQGENPPKGAALLEGSVANFVGLPVDGYLEIEGTRAEALAILRGSPLSAIKKLTQIKTDLTPIELVKLYSGAFKVRSDKLSLDSFQSDDLTKVDDFTLHNLFDSKLHQEQLPIAVYNGTNLVGRASSAARMIANLGGNVIIQSNFEVSNIKNSLIFSKNNSYTSKRLQSIFTSDCQNEKICDKLLNNELYSRADINVILGDN